MSTRRFTIRDPQADKYPSATHARCDVCCEMDFIREFVERDVTAHGFGGDHRVLVRREILCKRCAELTALQRTHVVHCLDCGRAVPSAIACMFIDDSENAIHLGFRCVPCHTVAEMTYDIYAPETDEEGREKWAPDGNMPCWKKG